MTSANRRSGTIDFWRGFVLLCIFANHIPGNLVESLTPRNFGLSDAAEAFIFISGLSVAMVYGSRVAAGLVSRCLARSLSLYRTHLAMSFAAIALFALAAVLGDVPDLLVPDGRDTVFGDTPRAVVGIVAMSHQLGYFNILPLYVALMLWAPVPILLARRHVGLALAVSVLIYAAARVFELNLPSWPVPGTWFFNPFAWQLTFTLGVVAAFLFKDAPVPFSSQIFGVAIAFLALSLFILKDGFGLHPGLWDEFREMFDVSKQDEGILRILHFLALAYVVHHMRLGDLLRSNPAGLEVERVGRHGLPVFAVGSLLCAVGQALMALAEAKHSASPALVGLVYTLLGMGGLVLLARYLEWNSTAAGRAASSAPVSSPALFAGPPSPAPRQR